MRPTTLALLAVTAAILLPAGGATAASACGSVNGGFETSITASGVSCAKAKSVARKWHKKALADGPGGTKYVGSFTCNSRPTDPEHVKVNCSHGKQKVRFFAGP